MGKLTADPAALACWHTGAWAGTVDVVWPWHLNMEEGEMNVKATSIEQ